MSNAPDTKDDDAVEALYELRLTEDFFRDVREGWEHFRLYASESIADEWEISLMREVIALRKMPRRWAVSQEKTRFRQEVRRLTHRRVTGSPAYYVYYAVRETPSRQVIVFAARHASLKPLTRAEIKDLEKRIP